MRRIAAIAAAVIVSTGALNACGGNDDGDSKADKASGSEDTDTTDFCKAIKPLAEASDAEGKDMSDELEALKDTVPADLAAAWDVYVDAYGQALDAQSKLPDAPKMPEVDPDASPKEQQSALADYKKAMGEYQEQIGAAFKDLDTDEIKDSTSKITAFMKDECGLDLPNN